MQSIARTVAVLVIVWSASQVVVLAQEPPLKSKSAPRVRVALVNYGAVFTKSEMAKDFKKEIEDAIEPLKAEANEIKVRMQAIQGDLAKESTPKEVAANLREQLKECTAQLEGLDKKARGSIGKSQEKQVVQIWIEIKKAVADQAKKRNVDVVFAYGDPPGEKDVLTNINRYMSAIDTGGIVPVFIRDGADITDDVLDQHNEAYRARKRQLIKTVDPK